MIFSSNRQNLRKFYQDCWQKHLTKVVLSHLELQVVEIINEHPEYQAIIRQQQSLQQEWFPELDDANPFLHLGLHLAVREQLSTDSPHGIRNLVKPLLKNIPPHKLEHKLMDCLSEAMHQQVNHQNDLNIGVYLECISKINWQ